MKAVANCLPLGRITELVGDEDSGKTFYSLNLLNKNAMSNGLGIYVNVDKKISTNMNMNNNILILNHNKAEDIIMILKQMIQSTSLINLVIVDSIPLLNEDTKTIKSFIKELAKLAATYNIAIVMVNQYRNYNDRELSYLEKTVNTYSSMKIITKHFSDERRVNIVYQSYKVKLNLSNRDIFY